MNISEVYKAINSNERVRQLVKTAPLNIIEQMDVKKFDTKQFVLHQGESYQNTYLLVNGRVKVFLNSPSGKQVVLDVYDSGMFLGEQEAIINRPYSASIINISPITVLSIRNSDFVEWSHRDHRFADRLIHNLSEQIYHLTKRMERYSMHSALQQIGLFLLYCAHEHIPITRERITYEVDTSYRNINRVLKKLADINVIQINRSIIKITDFRTLQQIVETED
ncbi:cyclic nucleotide-binding protein [Limosilactobacillus reuteri]|uniref:Cyclic nucleotide-binding protein n=1 Tax=Limosilactobacillus reuteri TaxID=1598 RepID=A0A256VNQ1_LIMRT|nr:Crp/Fnr family transcriptional regulator [Limosilactobacillus reuteri]OYS61109.1 cyclic nucleotide-binding protein [Limosilactobacillus reuteri]OYS62514.1 cyclic nucleotide-binding protein [Limosilactobacillus reuteri]OYS66019.1 cyclic nucleotide-binding protein [Limosilactobacillus reuteri]OYS74146.1 cyclic nucleotide-binding protein [Limosilactobacillus reuteri]OYS76469.1 cyclic nucleotide-binding protein [Limosilactobacillus reuteri]